MRKVVANPNLQWITDIGMTVGSYFLLSGISSSYASALGCATTGICVSLYLSHEGKNKWKEIKS